MKPLFPIILFVAGLLPAADTVPVTLPGFIKVPLTGNGGAAGSVLTFRTLPVTTTVLYEGTATSKTTNTLVDVGATWADAAFASGCYLEIVSVNGSTTAAGVGTTYGITGNAAITGTITLASSMDDSITTPVMYRIRKYWTMGTLLGTANSAGLQGGSVTNADQVILWDGAGFDAYFYQTSGIGGTGWRKLGDQTVDASGTIIYPNTAVMVKRGQSSTVNLIVSGSLKSGQTAVSLSNGYNYVGNPYASAMTLTSSGLYTGSATTGVASGTTASAADQVLIWNGSGYVTYYYNSTHGGWRSSTDTNTDMGGTAIGAGTGFIVRRVSGGGLTWTAPQHPASL